MDGTVRNPVGFVPYNFGGSTATERRGYKEEGIGRNRAHRARLQRGGGDAKTCFLRNEPNCNVEKTAFMWLIENELDRLQKNDKWVRFFRSGRKARGARRQSGTVAALTARLQQKAGPLRYAAGDRG